MPMYQPGLVHTPVTPFTRERGIDFDRYAKLIDFHLAAGADASAIARHQGQIAAAIARAVAYGRRNL